MSKTNNCGDIMKSFITNNTKCLTIGWFQYFIDFSGQYQLTNFVQTTYKIRGTRLQTHLEKLELCETYLKRGIFYLTNTLFEMLQHNVIFWPFLYHLSRQCKVSVKDITDFFSGTFRQNLKLSPTKDINTKIHKIYLTHEHNIRQ